MRICPPPIKTNTPALPIFKGRLNFGLNVLPEFKVLTQFKHKSEFKVLSEA
jgi:hypothetical protein